MVKRFLGNSRLYLSPIGLGTWQFSKGKGLAGKFWGVLPDSEICDIVLAALENDINWFDTAEVYGNGESEKALANALIRSEKPSCEINIATKWNPTLKKASKLASNIDERLKNLKGYPIQIYQIHNSWSLSSIKEEMRQMAILAKSGKTKLVGVSNYSASQMVKAHRALQEKGLFLASNQVKYNLLDRKIESNGVLQAAKENNISIIAYSPLEQGLLTGKYHENPGLLKNVKDFRKYRTVFGEKFLRKSYPLIEELKKTARRHNATVAQIALNWTINYHGNSVFAIPGASTTKQAVDNALAMNIVLSEQEMQAIDGLSSIFK